MAAAAPGDAAQEYLLQQLYQHWLVPCWLVLAGHCCLSCLLQPRPQLLLLLLLHPALLSLHPGARGQSCWPLVQHLLLALLWELQAAEEPREQPQVAHHLKL